MKVYIPHDWCVEMAQLEGDAEVGAGALALDLAPGQTPGLGSTLAAPPDYPTFGRLVRFLRREHNLSLEQLADQARLHLPDLVAVERDADHTPNLRTVYQIAKHFKLQASGLLQLAGLAAPSDPSLSDSAVRFAANSDPTSELSDQQRAILEALISELNERP